MPHVNVTGFQSVLMNDWQMNDCQRRKRHAVHRAERHGPLVVGIGNDYAARPSGASTVAEYFQHVCVLAGGSGNLRKRRPQHSARPAYADIDASIFKNFSFSERWRLQFRAEAFNVQNRANFQNPNSTVSAGVTFGRITSALDPRVLQFALKLFF